MRPPTHIASSDCFAQAAQSLCKSCGLCCDGTLFGQIALTAEDDVTALTSLPIRVAAEVTPPALKQPCTAYKNCTCSIYPDRPHACRHFRCALLRRFEANLTPETEALKVVQEALALRDELKKQLRAAFGPDSCSLDQFTARLKAKCKSDVSVGTMEPGMEPGSQLFRTFAALWLYINKHFQDHWQR